MGACELCLRAMTFLMVDIRTSELHANNCRCQLQRVLMAL